MKTWFFIPFNLFYFDKYKKLIDCEKKIKFYKSPEYVKIPDNVINDAEMKKNKYEAFY